MGDGGFNQVEVTIISFAVGQFVMMEFFQMRFTFKPFLARPAFAYLLQ